MGHFFISVIFSSCEQLLLTLWRLSPKLATHLAFSVFAVKPLTNIEEFAVSCWKHGASRRLEQPIEWYPFALKNLSASAVMVGESWQDFVHPMLYVDTEPQQGREVQTFFSVVNFSVSIMTWLSPHVCKAQCSPPIAVACVSEVFRWTAAVFRNIKAYRLTGVPYVQGPWIPYSCGGHRELKWRAIIDGKLISNKFCAVKPFPSFDGKWVEVVRTQNTFKYPWAVCAPGLPCSSLWCGMETLSLVGLHSTHSQKDRFLFPRAILSLLGTGHGMPFQTVSPLYFLDFTIY